MAKKTSRLIPAVGTAIRTWRQRRKLTLSQLAERAGIDTGFLAHIESGRKAPSLRTLESLADALGLAAGELFAPTRGPAQTLLRAEAEAICQNCSRSHLTDVLRALRLLRDPAKVKGLLALCAD